MADSKELPGSYREPAPELAAAPPVDPAERIEVSVYLKPDTSAASGPEQAAAAMPSRAAVKAAREDAHAPDLAALRAFAEQAGLEVTCEDLARRLVRIAGPADKMQAAFGATLQKVEQGGQTMRARSGSLSLPADLADRVLAVLGLDTRPIATPKIVSHANAAAGISFLPTEIAALYDFPKQDASGQCIAIIELGGGYTDADNQAAFAAMGLPVPPIVAVGVAGAANTPTTADSADGEVALDIQVCGGAAPGARLAVYFAPNTGQGFVDAITEAAHDQTNAPSVISISWGGPENGWTGQEVAAMSAAFQDAATVGVTVFAASGDSLATDGVKDGKLHVDYPASDPLVIGCGGTLIAADQGAIAHETVWNSNGGGTGGGISSLFALPSYQSRAHVPLPQHGKHHMRGVPDVAGDADPESGYRIVVDGKHGVFGGTSAVAPLWAALFALVNAKRGSPIGRAHDQLYAAANAFRDIVSGDNKVGTIGYKAKKGWDPCTGLGSPVGSRIIDAF